MTKTVVILGGSYGGLHVAHYLLKQKPHDVKVILVSKVSYTQTSPQTASQTPKPTARLTHDPLFP